MRNPITKVNAGIALLASTLAFAACAPAAHTPEEKAREAAETFIATAESDEPQGVCYPTSNITSGIPQDSEVMSIEQLSEKDDGSLVFEVNLSPEGYLQVVTGAAADESACVLSAVPWSG